MLHSSMKYVDSMTMQVLSAVLRILEMHDPYTYGHEVHVGRFARAIGIEVGYSENRAEGLFVTGLLHDIGKLLVPAEILCRPRKLNKGEMAACQEHAAIGAELIGGIQFPWPVKCIVLQHHERYDGSGYPYGLKDGDILEEACIIAVADVMEAITSRRPYRPALGLNTAIEEIKQGAGRLYRPDVVDAALAVLDSGFSFPGDLTA